MSRRFHVQVGGSPTVVIPTPPPPPPTTGGGLLFEPDYSSESFAPVTGTTTETSFTAGLNPGETWAHYSNPCVRGVFQKTSRYAVLTGADIPGSGSDPQKPAVGCMHVQCQPVSTPADFMVPAVIDNSWNAGPGDANVWMRLADVQVGQSPAAIGDGVSWPGGPVPFDNGSGNTDTTNLGDSMTSVGNVPTITLNDAIIVTSTGNPSPCTIFNANTLTTLQIAVTISGSNYTVLIENSSGTTLETHGPYAVSSGNAPLIASTSSYGKFSQLSPTVVTGPGNTTNAPGALTATTISPGNGSEHVRVNGQIAYTSPTSQVYTGPTITNGQSVTGANGIVRTFKGTTITNGVSYTCVQVPIIRAQESTEAPIAAGDCFNVATGDVNYAAGFSSRSELYDRFPPNASSVSATSWPDPVGTVRWYRVGYYYPSTINFTGTATNNSAVITSIPSGAPLPVVGATITVPATGNPLSSSSVPVGTTVLSVAAFTTTTFAVTLSNVITISGASPVTGAIFTAPMDTQTGQGYFTNTQWKGFQGGSPPLEFEVDWTTSNNNGVGTFKIVTNIVTNTWTTKSFNAAQLGTWHTFVVCVSLDPRLPSKSGQGYLIVYSNPTGPAPSGLSGDQQPSLAQFATATMETYTTHTMSATATNGSNTMTTSATYPNVFDTVTIPSTSALKTAGASVPGGTIVTGFSGGVITLSNPVTITSTNSAVSGQIMTASPDPIYSKQGIYRSSTWKSTQEVYLAPIKIGQTIADVWYPDSAPSDVSPPVISGG
jgi:hypothetical protein